MKMTKVKICRHETDPDRDVIARRARFEGIEVEWQDAGGVEIVTDDAAERFRVEDVMRSLLDPAELAIVDALNVPPLIEYWLDGETRRARHSPGPDWVPTWVEIAHRTRKEKSK